VSTTYSFLDLKGSITNPLASPFIFQGQIGLVRITIRNVTDHTAQNVAADGAVMISAKAGDNAIIEIEVQQTCDLHAYLLALFNTLNTALKLGNVQSFAATAIYLQNITDLSIHTLTGISFTKVPDKPYAAEGQTMIWTLMAANAQQVTL
jgi:hypothetical protein